MARHRPDAADAAPPSSPPPPGTASDEVRHRFGPALVEWQRTHGRHRLPWQQTRDPYRVWLSEIMLQQTQVATVLGYYERFLQRFPDVATLAAAPLDEVLALWSGLGYYSRARNLHRCAQAVVAEHGGAFPASAAVLETLPGIGRSTAAAVAAFCFGERVAILDGNVKRVLTRLLGFEADLAQAAAERALWAQASALLPEHGIESYTQGLMDLGATVCLPRSPNCLLCPAAELCTARREGAPERYPVKTRRLKRGRREHWWLWLRHEDATWLVQRPDSGVWAGLFSLPEFDSREALDAATAALGAGRRVELPVVEHALTHFDWRLHPVRLELDEAPPPALLAALGPGGKGRWADAPRLAALGVPAPLRKLLLGDG
ncbi:A/G-specific adenine glycosylase [Caldimonas tepidiphila]|uniref:A/G-specific adenine glycosylase n=1 Tax=Caldimonas tepidiphila TaxID=2315841 RepID=UPI000E5C0C07|nr:A/G-specific adenine glycosylase [Caldimonas tepidiphila]